MLEENHKKVSMPIIFYQICLKIEPSPFERPYFERITFWVWFLPEKIGLLSNLNLLSKGDKNISIFLFWLYLPHFSSFCCEILWEHKSC